MDVLTRAEMLQLEAIYNRLKENCSDIEITSLIEDAIAEIKAGQNTPKHIYGIHKIPVDEWGKDE